MEMSSYGSEPRSDYQKRLRRESTLLMNHVTRTFNDLNVERICEIPKRPGADHHDLPDRWLSPIHRTVSPPFDDHYTNVSVLTHMHTKNRLSVTGQPLRPWCLTAPESAASRHNGWKGEQKPFNCVHFVYHQFIHGLLLLNLFFLLSPGLYGRLDMEVRYLTPCIKGVWYNMNQ